MSDTATTTKALLSATDLHKHYRMGSEDLHVLVGVSVSIQPGQWLGVLGRSGSGKSTLLHLLGGLDTPDSGRVMFDGVDLFAMNGRRRDRLRNQRVGFVFQFYHLLPELSVLENTIVAAMIGSSLVGWPAASGALKTRAHELLDKLGLGERLKHRPNELSGGERQRVAIARALINKPDVLLADEPTGNLDRATGATIMDLFEELRAEGQTIVMVTHDPTIAERADRTLKLEAGRLAG